MSTEPINAITLFYCYAHEDELYLKELEKQLAPFKRLGQITSWYDRQIAPGTKWQQEIEQHLTSASLILLLISPDFIYSDACDEEMRKALELHHAGRAQVIPILLRPVVWEGIPIGDLQLLPLDGKRLDKLQPFCRIAGHTSAEVQEILATLETVCRETFPQLNLRQWSGAIYSWLTHPLLDPTSSGRVVMGHLMKLVTIALEWSYEAGETEISAETLQAAAELLTLGRDTIRLIDGAGPTVEIPRSDTTEQESVQEAEAGEAPAKDAPKQRASHHNEVGETHRAVPSTNCSFSGPIELEAGRLLQSTVEVVQCPPCGSVSKAKLKGQTVVIAPHPPRKSRPVRNVTRWMEQGTEWTFVQKKE